ncbi:MAG: hypothetical protein PWR01_2842 [Clostridiales bacterium]|nr:hypothetical protein [Clostridiales bacterium]MDN5281769.1 hypothetical protein [Candidatus Ozemobacter sp.]
MFRDFAYKKRIRLVCMIFLIHSTLPVFSNQADLDKIEKIVDKAYETMQLSLEISSGSVNNEQFLQEAELRLKFAEIGEGLHNFLNSDYMNFSLYLLSIKFNRSGAALLVLKRQLLQEKEKKVIDWLLKRIDEVEKNWNKLGEKSAINHFKQLFR